MRILTYWNLYSNHITTTNDRNNTPHFCLQYEVKNLHYSFPFLNCNRAHLQNKYIIISKFCYFYLFSVLTYIVCLYPTDRPTAEFGRSNPLPVIWSRCWLIGGNLILHSHSPSPTLFNLDILTFARQYEYQLKGFRE